MIVVGMFAALLVIAAVCEYQELNNELDEMEAETRRVCGLILGRSTC